MTDEEYQFILFDRVEKIKQIASEYDLENTSYVSHSGGKDSCVISALLDIALPNNKIPRVYKDTGIEYRQMRKFVRQLCKKDSRFIYIKPNKNIKNTLSKVGYPFKSKEHSMRVDQFNKGSNAKFIKKYLGQTDYKGQFVCPKSLLYQFEEKGKYHYSNLCCNELKKKPIHKWQKETKRSISITGMRKEEGGNRAGIKGCILTNKKGNIVKFHPLLVVNDDFENWFIEKNNIKLCKLYREPFNFKRTGCVGCPYSLDLQEQLDTMAMFLPNEKKQCEMIWKPVYQEYRRLGYRLRKDTGQMSIFDFIEKGENNGTK